MVISLGKSMRDGCTQKENVGKNTVQEASGSALKRESRDQIKKQKRSSEMKENDVQRASDKQKIPEIIPLLQLVSYQQEFRGRLKNNKAHTSEHYQKIKSAIKPEVKRSNSHKKKASQE